MKNKKCKGCNGKQSKCFNYDLQHAYDFSLFNEKKGIIKKNIITGG